jgi:hypothetical protein
LTAADEKLKKSQKWKKNVKKLAENYRKNQMRAKPELYTAVKPSQIRVFEACPAMIDSSAALEEWGKLKPKLVKLKGELGVECTVRTMIANLLSGGQHALPESDFPNMRLLLQITLVIPASSAQSERDFSAQVRVVC